MACPKSMGNQLIKLGECVNRLCSPGASTSDMPAQLCVARDGVSFHMTDQCYYVQRNPANEIWWSQAGSVSNLAILMPNWRFFSRCPLCFPVDADGAGGENK